MTERANPTLLSTFYTIKAAKKWDWFPRNTASSAKCHGKYPTGCTNRLFLKWLAPSKFCVDLLETIVSQTLQSLSCAYLHHSDTGQGCNILPVLEDKSEVHQ